MIDLSTLDISSPVSYLVAVIVPALDAILPVLPSETAVIALGVATLVATRALNQSMTEAVRGATAPLAGVADLHVSNGESGVPITLADDLARIEGVRRVEPVVVGRVRMPDLENQRQALLLGIMWRADSADNNPWGVRVDWTIPPESVPGLKGVDPQNLLAKWKLDAKKDVTLIDTANSATIAVLRSRIRREDSIRLLAKLPLQPLPVLAHRLRPIRPPSHQRARKDRYFIHVAAHNHRHLQLPRRSEHSLQHHEVSNVEMTDRHSILLCLLQNIP